MQTFCVSVEVILDNAIAKELWETRLLFYLRRYSWMISGGAPMLLKAEGEMVLMPGGSVMVWISQPSKAWSPMNWAFLPLILGGRVRTVSRP